MKARKIVQITMLTLGRLTRNLCQVRHCTRHLRYIVLAKPVQIGSQTRTQVWGCVWSSVCMVVLLRFCTSSHRQTSNASGI